MPASNYTTPRGVISSGPTDLYLARYQPLAEAINAYRNKLGARDLRVVVEFLEFANQTLAEATSHARCLEAQTHGRLDHDRPAPLGRV